MSYYDDVCEYSYSQSYDNYENFGAAGATTTSDSKKSYDVCSVSVGEDVICGTLSYAGTTDEKYERTNALACPDRAGGHKGSYACIGWKDGSNKVNCGCMWEYDAKADENILPAKYLAKK